VAIAKWNLTWLRDRSLVIGQNFCDPDGEPLQIFRN
jgi:hypothetical protein